MIDIQTLPIVEPKFYGRITGSRTKRLLVLHDGEWPERPAGAMGLAKYFQKPDRGTKPSSHLCGDNKEIVRCVTDNNVANAAPGANHDGLQYEMVGYGRQTRAEWLDDYSRGVISLAAEAFAQWCVKYAIPPRQLTDAQLGDHQSKGIIGHYQASRVFKLSTHTDPGSGFPWDVFMLGIAASMPKIQLAPKVGDRRWSNYFKNWVYLASFVSDNEWWFTVGTPNGRPVKAQTAWTKMPRAPGEGSPALPVGEVQAESILGSA